MVLGDRLGPPHKPYNVMYDSMKHAARSLTSIVPISAQKVWAGITWMSQKTQIRVAPGLLGHCETKHLETSNESRVYSQGAIKVHSKGQERPGLRGNIFEDVCARRSAPLSRSDLNVSNPAMCYGNDIRY